MSHRGMEQEIIETFTYCAPRINYARSPIANALVVVPAYRQDSERAVRRITSDMFRNPS